MSVSSKFLTTIVALAILVGVLPDLALAQYFQKANFNDARIAEAADIIFTYLNGSFGAMMMVCSGIAAIIAGAFGQYRAFLGLMVVAVGSFIIRSLVSTFFNDISLQVG